MKMKIETYSSEEVRQRAAQHCAARLIDATTHHTHVLLLLSGGSAISMYKSMFGFIDENYDLSSLQVALVDERFGPSGHADSNEQQLFLAGVISELESRGAVYTGILPTDTDVIDQDQPMERVSQRANTVYREMFERAEYVLVLAGMGDDGHSAGWLPTQTKEKFTAKYEGNVDDYIVSYTVDGQDSNNPHHKRITISLRVSNEVDEIILFITGQNKADALKKYIESSFQEYQLPVMKWNNCHPVIITDVKLE